jgi:murein DD-endopeptidase MepM/ murein hydrolase activator NlpD
LKTIYILIVLTIFITSCNKVIVNQKKSNDFSKSFYIEWDKYLKNIEKLIKSTDDKSLLLKIKTNLISLYIEGRDQFYDFPNDISIKISLISEKIDKKITNKLSKKENHFKSIDIIATKIEKNNFFGALDDGTDTSFTERDLKSSYYWPLKKIYITSPYGFRGDPFEEDKIRFHHGVDLDGDIGDYVLSTNHGKVVFADKNGSYGLMVMISHPNNILSIYGHLSEIIIKLGERVQRGSVIGKVGSTGRSTGPHLHFEIRKNNQSIDPIFFIESQGLK